MFFKVQFDEISLVSLVKYSSVRNYLNKSMSDLSSNNYKDSITNSQIAFKELMWCYETENTKRFESILGKSCDFSHQSSFHMKMGLGSDFDSFIDNVSESIPLLEERLNIIGLGIDYLRYRKFKLLSPCIEMWLDEKADNRYSVFIDEERDRRICSQKMLSSALIL